MSTFSSDIGPEEENGGGWSGLVPTKAEREEDKRFERERLTVHALKLAVHAMRAPLDEWKGELERKALDAAHVALGAEFERVTRRAS